MSVNNIMQRIDQARGRKLTLTANSELTVAQIMEHSVINMASYTITLPAASAAMKLRTVRICNSSTAANLTCSEGFGGGTSSTDVVAVANGQFYDFFCDGTYWYYCGAAAAS